MTQLFMGNTKYPADRTVLRWSPGEPKKHRTGVTKPTVAQRRAKRRAQRKSNKGGK